MLRSRASVKSIPRLNMICHPVGNETQYPFWNEVVTITILIVCHSGIIHVIIIVSPVNQLPFAFYFKGLYKDYRINFVNVVLWNCAT